MQQKWLAGVALLIFAVSACTPEPPPYESRYTPSPQAAPPTLVAPALPLPPGSSFVDDFERPDTALGLGEGWDMRAPGNNKPILPAATDGFIRGGHFSTAGDSTVYAVRTFRTTVRRVGAEARWTRFGAGGSEMLVMAIPANDRLKSDLVQLAVQPSGWNVTTRRDSGRFRTVISGKFSPLLELDREYQFEMDVADGSITVRVPGVERTVNVVTTGLVSERAFWQHYSPPKEAPIGVRFSVNMVWVAEQGQTLALLPDSE